MYYAVVCCCFSNESERVTRTREKGNAMLDDVALILCKVLSHISTTCFYYLLGHDLGTYLQTLSSTFYKIDIVNKKARYNGINAKISIDGIAISSNQPIFVIPGQKKLIQI